MKFNRLLLIALLIAAIFSCKNKNESKQNEMPVVKQTIMPVSSFARHHDTLFAVDDKTYWFKYHQEVIPNSFVLVEDKQGATKNLLLFPDYQLSFELSEGEKSYKYIITKDSLLRDITKEHLNLSLIDKLYLDHIDLANKRVVLFFEVRKPDDFEGFYYNCYVDEKGVRLEIIEE